MTAFCLGLFSLGQNILNLLCVILSLLLRLLRLFFFLRKRDTLNIDAQQGDVDEPKDARPTAFEQRGGNVVFSEDFSNGFAGTNGNGEWTVEDNGENSIWVYVASGNQGFYVDGSPTGSSHPGGQFSFDNTNPFNPQYFPLESSTASNGWMVFDADYYNTVNFQTSRMTA